MSRARALVDEIANELDTWPGVRIGRRADGAAVVLYEDLELVVRLYLQESFSFRVATPEAAVALTRSTAY